MKIGDKKRFIPTAWFAGTKVGLEHIGAMAEVTGTIVDIRPDQCWYRVEYTVFGVTLHECFKYIPASRIAVKMSPPLPEGRHTTDADHISGSYTQFCKRNPK